ncbi:hypothetical protein [Lacrimispora xylanisolvens]|uniref:hypothetical protein n=1 Tax=Lacrimispora xylanisolvens TaxID=384636 RepID=UPI003D9CB08B
MEWVSRLGQPKETNHSASKAFSASSAEPGNRTDKNYDKLKQTVHQEVIREYNDRFSDNANGRSIDVMEIIHQAIARQEESLTRLEESKLAQEIHDDVMGLGPLEPLLRDDSISEIMVNSARQIYIERGGRLEQTPASFRDDAHVLKVINRIVSSVGRRCDEATPHGGCPPGRRFPCKCHHSAHRFERSLHHNQKIFFHPP